MKERIRRQIPGLGYVELSLDRGSDVAVGDRRLPPWVDVTITGAGRQSKVVLHLEVINKVPQCREIKISATSADWEITNRSLRLVDIDELVRYVYKSVSYRIVDRAGSVTVIEGTASEPPAGWNSLSGQKGRGARKITPEFLAEVAQVYRDSISGNPSQAVERTFGVSKRMSGEYIRRARDLELLPETTPGKKLA